METVSWPTLTLSERDHKLWCRLWWLCPGTLRIADFRVISSFLTAVMDDFGGVEGVLLSLAVLVVMRAFFWIGIEAPSKES